MNFKRKAKWLVYSALTLFIAASANVQAGDKVSSDELKSLLVGNFMKIVYIYEGKDIQMWEYYQKDGTVAGSTDKWGDYSATYTVNDKDQICLTYGSEAYDGCYSYMRVADGQYKLVGLTWPENTTLDVTIVPGHSNNIGG